MDEGIKSCFLERKRKTVVDEWRLKMRHCYIAFRSDNANADDKCLLGYCSYW